MSTHDTTAHSLQLLGLLQSSDDHRRILNITIATLAITTAVYLVKFSPLSLFSLVRQSDRKAGHTKEGEEPRNICRVVELEKKNCLILYGSQTGTAEAFATTLAREGKSRYGLATMVADLEQYDYDDLPNMPAGVVVIFVLATYGEGEPPDNAVDFYELVTGDDPFTESGDRPLGNIRYAVFGLGNKTYEHYSATARIVDKQFQAFGATRIGEIGEGDDGEGNTEVEFMAWKRNMWEEVMEKMKFPRVEVQGFNPAFDTQSSPHLSDSSPQVFLGEPNAGSLSGTAVTSGPFDAHNPYVATITESRSLVEAEDKRCLHLEVDLNGSGLTYETGDHLAIWPMNSNQEVDLFLDVMGLAAERDSVFSVKALDPTASIPFPTPTTYQTAVLYYMEISAPVSRQMVELFASFAPTKEIEADMMKLAGDNDRFDRSVTGRYMTLSRLLRELGQGFKWTRVPFSAIIEGLPHLRPRYYSISSSSLVQPTTASLTIAVDWKEVQGREDPFKGVASTYVLATHRDMEKCGAVVGEMAKASYELGGPRGRYEGHRIPIHFRHSRFRLPSDPLAPVILIGPGTGVAPLRAFVQERANGAENGETVGEIMLFFGCRRSSQDFLYRSEWKKFGAVLGDKFQLFKAFSRETSTKTYVQHLIKKEMSEVNRLIESNASIYVCGDAATMARQVKATLVEGISQHRGISADDAAAIVHRMITKNQYQEDVW